MKKICQTFMMLLFIFFVIGCKTPEVPPLDNSEIEEQPQQPSDSQDPDDNNEENQESDNQQTSNPEDVGNSENKEEKFEELYIEEYDNQIIIGEGNYEEFHQRTQNKEKLILKVKKTYILDPDKYSQEYYEQIKDDYPQIVELTITFDGEVYKITDSYGTEETYKYYYYSVTNLSYRDDFRVARTYLFTNDKDMTYELYQRYMTSSKWEEAQLAFSSYLFGLKITHIITYEDTKFLNFNYEHDKNSILSKTNEEAVFYYLDNLMWGQLQNFNSNNYTPSENVITLSTKRKIIDTVLEETPLELNKEYQVDYIIDIDNSVVNVLFKDNGNTVYSVFADAESLKLKELLEELNIDYKYTYIQPSNYCGTLWDKYTVNVEMVEDSITFTHEYNEQKMEIKGKYKVFGNQLLCELDMDMPLDGYYSMETYSFTYTITEEGIEYYNPYARYWFNDFEYYSTNMTLKKQN